MKVGIQLFSVRDHLKENPVGTLEKLAGMGYKYIELANHSPAADPGTGFGISAKEMRRVMEAYGLEIIGTHLWPLDTDRLSTLDPILEYQQVIGCPYIVWGTDRYFSTLESIKTYGEQLGRIGGYIKERGLGFCFHNHSAGFLPLAGKTGYEYLMEHTDPVLVQFELDTFWCARGGADPVEIIQKLGKRLTMLHQKDLHEDHKGPVNLYLHDHKENEDPTHHMPLSDFAEIGTGVLPIQDYIDAGNRYGTGYIILEQDFTQLDELESVKISMDHFKKFSGIQWN